MKDFRADLSRQPVVWDDSLESYKHEVAKEAAEIAEQEEEWQAYEDAARAELDEQDRAYEA